MEEELLLYKVTMGRDGGELLLSKVTMCGDGGGAIVVQGDYG